MGIYTTTALFLSSCSLSTNNNTWVVSLSSSFHMKLSSFSLDGREAVYPVWGWQGEQGTNTRRTLIKHCVFMYIYMCILCILCICVFVHKKKNLYTFSHQTNFSGVLGMIFLLFMTHVWCSMPPLLMHTLQCKMTSSPYSSIQSGQYQHHYLHYDRG